MAEVLVVGGGLFAGPLGAYLRETLPDSLYVVIGPLVWGYELDAVVVGTAGLAAIRVAEPAQAAAGTAGQATQTGKRAAAPVAGGPAVLTPAADAERTRKALAAFLGDEYPGLKPQVLCLRVAPPADAGSSDAWTVVEPPEMKDENLAESLIQAQAVPDPALGDGELREALALALRDRQLTANQRATQPLVFRSGGAFGNTVRAWTVRDAVQHMDRHPEDGVYHLRNGTLTEWLAGQGAIHLAQLARAAVHEYGSDARAALEVFLLGTGLVARPKLEARPRRVDLGYVLPGETAGGMLRLRRGRGRGYLFGALTPGDPCLDAEPRAFSGGPAEIAVRANTAGLAISGTPYQCDLLLDCSAAAEAVHIPVRFRVVAQPSAMNRKFMRPLALAALGGLLGAVIGALLGSLGGVAPAGPFSQSVSPAAWWAVVVGAAWAILGAVRAFRQPAAWPVRFAAARWLGWLAVWGVVLPAVALAFNWAWDRAGGAREQPFFSGRWLGIALLALACVVVPATFMELTAPRPATDVPRSSRRRWRAVAVPALGVLLIAAILAGVPLLRPAWQQPQTQAAITNAGQTTQDLLGQFGETVNRWVDQLYLRYYDRAAVEKAPASTRPAPPGATPAASE